MKSRAAPVSSVDNPAAFRAGLGIAAALDFTVQALPVSYSPMFIIASETLDRGGFDRRHFASGARRGPRPVEALRTD